MADLISEYRSLVCAEESIAALDRALGLARQIARGGRIINGQRRATIENEEDVERAQRILTKARIRVSLQLRIREVVKVLSSLPTLAEQPNVPEAQYSLLMDTLLIVFHQAYFSLLPKAGARRETLLQAFDAFARTLPNLADRFQVMGLVNLERGEAAQALEAFQAALAATPSDQHDFLTRVQILWSLLIEQEHVREAFNTTALTPLNATAPAAV